MTHPPTEAEAIRRFEQLWRSDLAPRLHPTGAAARLSPLVSGGAMRSAARRPCRAALAIVRDRLGPGDARAASLHGRPSALDREGGCWDIHYATPLGGGLAACVDARDGTVLLVWETPGG